MALVAVYRDGMHLLAGHAIHARALATGIPMIAYAPDAPSEESCGAIAAALPNVRSHVGSLVDMAGAMGRIGLTTTAIARILGVAQSEASRLCAASHIRVLADALVANRITLQHIRHLLPLAEPARSEALAVCIRRKMTAGQLARMLAGASPAQNTKTSDILAEEQSLGDALGTTVRITPSARHAGGTIAILWHTAADLSGVLEQLGRAPMPQHPLRPTPRYLRIEYTSIEEYEALVAHLRKT